MTSRAFRVVEMFEEALAEYAGSPWAVVTDSCTTAIFLSLLLEGVEGRRVSVPARTYVSVPFAVIRAGGVPRFVNTDWLGDYRMEPTRVVDSALRLRKGMWRPGELRCVSFHARKRLPIGRGGAILLEDPHDAWRLRQLRFDGRVGTVPYTQDSIDELGYNAYMTPEQAARGLQLLENLPDNPPDLDPGYPDVRKFPYPWPR